MVWRFGGWGEAMGKKRGRGGVPDRREGGGGGGQLA